MSSVSRKVKLPSGAELEIWVSPFEVSKSLYQAVLEEMKPLKIDPNAQVDVNLFKDVFCTGFSSKKIEECLKKCLEKATYNGARITPDTFEPSEAREDYMQVCFEVAQDNIAPFMKSLYAKFKTILKTLESVQA